MYGYKMFFLEAECFLLLFFMWVDEFGIYLYANSSILTAPTHNANGVSLRCIVHVTITVIVDQPHLNTILSDSLYAAI